MNEMNGQFRHGDDGVLRVMSAVFDIVDVFTSTMDSDRFLTLNETCREIAGVEAAVTYRIDSPGDLRLMAVSAVGVEDLAILVGHSESLLADLSDDTGVLDDRCLASYASDGSGVVVVLMEHSGRDGDHHVSDDDIEIVRLLVGISARLDAQLRRLEGGRVMTQQLQTALVSRVTIEQAKGVLAERLHVEPTEAFQILRRTARGSGRPLQDVALEVVETVV